MKKFLKISGIFLVLIVAVGFFLPQSYTATAVYSYDAPQEKLHEIISNLGTWREWGPWMEDDPNMKIEATQLTGVGASQVWMSEKAGNGKLVFTEVSPQTGVKYDLFFEGFPKSVAEFRYGTQEGKTQVEWIMKSTMPVPVVGGYMAIIFKPMIEKSFLKGLKNIEKML